MKHTTNRKQNRNIITLTVFLSAFLFLIGLQEAYAAPIQGVIRDQKYVSGQTSSYYNDGRYKGLIGAEYYEAQAQQNCLYNCLASSMMFAQMIHFPEDLSCR